MSIGALTASATITNCNEGKERSDERGKALLMQKPAINATGLGFLWELFVISGPFV
jgi:hypothetical protein